QGQRSQKARERMNVKVDHGISSRTGTSGLAVVRAILRGERNPEQLLALCDTQIQRAKAERVKESLRGTWAEEHLFALRQALQSWEHYQGQITECDHCVEALLHDMDPGEPPDASTMAARHGRPGINAPDIPNLGAM